MMAVIMMILMPVLTLLLLLLHTYELSSSVQLDLDKGLLKLDFERMRLLLRPWRHLLFAKQLKMRHGPAWGELCFKIPKISQFGKQ